ncbi:hypothetical protein BVC80_1741g114 [Macleaya cordata]|uniref:Leucine-rich repeat n=1 Tax=Macleaya cordata TaxID=56857 RepID=A0A200QL15_MACCD|nr:hypothetical protein BVC80_1741g114 [Macleaya cordata]
MSVSFPRLKILWLTFIIFADDYSTEQLFSNCPVLEELLISYCTWVNMKIVCISAPALKSLLVDGPETANIDGLHNCEVKIYAPNLVSFSYTGSVAKDCVLCSFSSLVHAEIDFAIEELHMKRGVKK